MKDDSNEFNRLRTGLLLAALLVIGCGLLLVVFAGLRENQAFWCHAGGYPLWLRDLVLWTYMPLLIGTVGLLCGMSITCLLKIVSVRRLFVVESILILLGWGIVTTSACIAFQNNVRNVITGGRVHNHQQGR